MEKVNEFFAIPINQIKLGTIFGVDLYTSDSLKQTFIKSIEATQYYHEIPNISDLINKNIINPVFSSKHIISFIMKKFPLFTSSNNDFDPDILAFYNHEDGKIYILIDSNTTDIIGRVENNRLGSLVVHELMHLFCARRPRVYLNYFKKELIAYYSSAFKEIFNATIPDDVIFEIVKTFCIKYEFGSNYALKEPVNYIFNQIKKFTSISEYELLNLITDYVLSWYYDLNDKNNLEEHRFMKFHMVFHSIYSKIFHIDVKDKDCLQESMTTSEVIATLAENGQLVNSIRKISKYLEKLYSR